MRSILVALVLALVLALGTLEVLASRATMPQLEPDPRDAFAIWHTR